MKKTGEISRGKEFLERDLPPSMVVLSKMDLTEEDKNRAMQGVLGAGMLAVAVQNVQLTPDAALLMAASANPIIGASNIALTSSMSGALEFFINPVLGKVTGVARTINRNP